MSKHHIEDTEEAWEGGSLGRDANHVAVLDDQEAESKLINDSLSLQPISIRLDKSLIEDFKFIASLNGLGYQTLMRQVLKRFSDCEKKQILREMASQMAAESGLKIEDGDEDNGNSEHKKAA